MNIKNEKGITLVVLVIIIVIMLILTFTLTTDVSKYVERKRKTDFDTDIGKIKEKIEIYYSRNKSIPIANKYTNIGMLNKNANDNDNYYVIDLNELELSGLNYGIDYYSIEDKTDEISSLLDIYIINEQSNSIYYPKGIEYEGKTYYSLENSSIKIQDIELESIKIIGENTVELGKKIKLNVATYPNFMESGNINWSVDNSKTATINENGELTALQCGTIIVTATLKENETIKDTFTVTIQYPTIQLSIIASKNSTINGEIPSYKNPIVPKGFKAVDATTGDNSIDIEASWKNEDGYKNGLVIEDENNKQYKWVACITSQSELEEGDTAEIYTESIIEKYNIKNVGLLPIEDGVITEEITNQAIQECIKTYQGFYIER